MFHSKQDVDRHVNEVFKNIKSEYQRNLKCYQIAKLYYKFKDYKSAIKYINRYILTTTNSAAAHRLLGECYLGFNLKVKAIEAFKASLVLNGTQNDLVLKICTLLMDPDVSTVTPRATYWLERAETLFPTNPVVFQLKEHLLKSNLDGKQDNGQLEKLIICSVSAEISARPADVTVRIRLLNFFVETKRYKLAYQHALEIEGSNTFSNDLRWYDCLCNVVQAYEKANSDLGFSFSIKKIIFFEKRADLSMQEFQEEIKTLSECNSALSAFDQNLHHLSKIEVPQEETYFFNEFLKHMRCQLSFHLATLMLKRAKKEYGIWPKAFRTASPLLLQATQNTMDLEEAWYNMWPGKNKMEKEIKQLNKCATLRISQAGHVLLAWSQSKGSKFLEKVSQFCGGKWQVHAYQDIFYNREHQLAIATSHFANDSFFVHVPMRLLTETELTHFDEVSQSMYPDSLHHLVWLGLAYCNANGHFSHDFRCTTVPDLQFTVVNLNRTGPETLNQLDVDAFLYASVLCAKSSTPNVVNSDRPSRLPVSISEELCSPAQAEWWIAVYKTYTNQSSGNIADTRLKLRKGIEVIRVFGQHGLHPKIIVTLAKLFQERAAKNKNPNEITGLEERAYLYWTAAIPILEKMEKNQQLREVPNRLFDYRGKDLSSNEIKSHLEDGRLFLARRLMKQRRHEQAIEALQSLKSPFATFYQALIYEELASEEVNHCPESITSENRSQHIILLTRARDALYLTLDRLRCPSVDPNHPLNSQLQDHLDQIERQLAQIDPDSNLKSGDSQSDETDIVPGPLGSDVDETLENSFNIYNTSNFLGVKNQSGSRTLRQNLQEKHPNARFEARPSPERLDAQLRHLVQANCNGLQAIVEQLKEMKAVMQIELKDLGCVTRDLLAEMKRWNDRLESVSKRTTEVLKPEDLFDLREEDYEDLNQLSQPYTPYSNYQANRQMTGTQGTSTITYGNPVPSPIPSVPAVQPVIPTPENTLIQPTFYPGPHPVPPLDPLLLYQSLGYYAPGVPYGENQNVSDFRGMGIQKGTPFAKNAFKAPDTVANSTVLTTKLQPPNVVITSSDTLPTFTSGSGTPAMSVTVPPQHIRGATPSSVAQKSSPSQVHPFQIQMPPQAQLVKESPTEKLNSLTPTTSPFKSPLQALISNIKSTPAQQASPLREITPAKSGSHTDRNNGGQKHEENKLFASRGKLAVFAKEWIDKGNVLIKILHDEKAGKVRIVAHQEPGFLVYVDHFIKPEMLIKPLAKNESGWVWTAENSQKTDLKLPEVLANSKCLKFRVHFDTFDEARDFEYAFNEGRRISKGPNHSEVQKSTRVTEEGAKDCKTCKGKAEGGAEQCSACLAKEKSSEKTNLGGFTFASSPIVKPPVLKLNEEKEKPKETPKPSPFAEFSFSTSTTTPSKTDAMPRLIPAGPFTSQNTASPNWFAGVKPDPNSFKKDANFKEFEGKGSLVFGYLNKNKTPTPKANKNGGEDDGEEEFVPTAEFAPVVDLPDLVDVKTGEENDKVLYDERAKLLRFDTNLKEWKERGVGGMRVLLNEENGKVRLIMRRELVLKVCCNHYLDEKMEFVRMTKSERALTWYAHDYSDGEIKAELFALKFSDPESMKRFEAAIRKAQAQMEDGRIKGAKGKDATEEKPKELQPLSGLFKPKAGSWECGTCLVRNNETATKCASCETPKPGVETSTTEANSQPVGLGKGISFAPSSVKFTFGIPQSTTGTTATPASISPSKFVCGIPQSTTTSTSFSSGVLQSSVDSTAAGAPTTKFIFGNPQITTATSQPSSAKSTSVTCSSTTTPTPSYTFGILKTGETSSDNVPVSTSAGIVTSSKTQTFPSFGALTSSGSTGFTFSMSFGVPQATVSSAGNIPVPTSAALFTSSAGQEAQSSAASGFAGFTSNSFGFSKPDVTSASTVPFSSPASTSALSTTQSAPSVGIFTSSTTPSFTFSIPNSGATKITFSPFTVPVSKAEDKSNTESNAPQWTVPTSTTALKPEGKEKFGFSLGNIKPATTKVSPQKTKSSSPKSKADGATSDGSGGEEDAENSIEAEEDNVIVKPIIPLPEKVAPHTGEEDEDVIYEQRAKLFRFIGKEWKERGIGAVKILKHRIHNKIRVLMRRETILKVCLNHYLTPDIEFKPMGEKTWTWAAADFSDGEVQCYLFAIRFKTPEIAREFKQALDDVQKNSTLSSTKEEKAKEFSAVAQPLALATSNVTEPEPPAGSQSNKPDDDVLVVYENKVTPEQRQKAISLHLPPNFYAYLQAPDCPGCPGCDKEDAPVRTEQTPAPVTTSNTIFGNKSWGTLNFGGDDSSQKKILFTFAGNQGTPTWNAGLTAQKLTPATKIENENGNENEDDDEEEEEEEDDDDEDDEDEEENEDEAEDEDEEEEDEEDFDDEDEDLQEEEYEDNENEDAEDEDYGEGEG